MDDEEYPDNGPTDPWETSGPGRKIQGCFEPSCCESWHMDDGVPYCDKCGIYRNAIHIQERRKSWRNPTPSAPPSSSPRSDTLGQRMAVGRGAPTDDDLKGLIKPLWIAEKPSREAQGIRAELSTAVDDGRYPQWALDYVPDYVWSLIDIAAQRGINAGRKADV